MHVVGTLVLSVTKGGTGSGTVAGDPPGINCGAVCTQVYASATAVTLIATAAPGSVFVGWLGACSGVATCNVNVSALTGVLATFAPDTVPLRLDIDGNNAYGALTDGLLAIRYLFALTGAALTNGVIGAGATRTTPADIALFIDNIKPLLDVDGNGQVEALTDGLLFIRYLFGLRGAALIAGVIGTGATRTTAAAIEAYIQVLTP